MISRLLRELGVPLDWADSQDSQVMVETVGRAAGVFFVENAAEATDHQGRKIIVAQDFVSRYDVKSVFGTGGVYPGGQMLVVVVFCRDIVSRALAEQYLALRNWFQSKTTALVGAMKIFAEG